MATRRNILAGAAVAKAFAEGVRALKQEPSEFRPSSLGIPRPGGAPDTPFSTWDLFVLWHWHAMTTSTGGGRNAAHRGPVFLPWHRWLLLELEAQLQRVLGDPDFGLPYWDWAADGDRPPGQQASGGLWVEGVMGAAAGTGRVVSGPFTVAKGFRVRLDHNQAQGLFATSRGLRRSPGRAAATLPTSTQVKTVVEGQTVYDADPWTAASRSGFRNLVEGNIAFTADSVAELHNRVHVWVGGDMLPPTSPNDPVFYLNHCNVDRLWSRWQARNRSAGYRPASGAPALAGHRRTDPMFRPFWWSDDDPVVRPADMLDVSARYVYDAV